MHSIFLTKNKKVIYKNFNIFIVFVTLNIRLETLVILKADLRVLNDKCR